MITLLYPRFIHFLHCIICLLTLIHDLCLSSLELRLNLTLQILGLLRTRPPPLDLAIPADQELLKIPLHALHSQQSRLLVLQPLKRRIRLIPIHINFAEHRETDAVVDLAERLDLVVGARVLPTELIAREADDFKVIRVRGLEVFVEFLEAGELGREAAFGGCVDDEDDFVLKVGEGVGVSLLYGVMLARACVCVCVCVCVRERGRKCMEEVV
jgi:hypothetical protein